MYIKSKKKKQIKNFNRTAISWYLRKQVGVIAWPIYSAFVAFLQVSKINIKIKRNEIIRSVKDSGIIVEGLPASHASDLKFTRTEAAALK